MPDAVQIEPINGWRIWNLARGPEGTRLRPAGSGADGGWEPGNAFHARCGLPRWMNGGIGRHTAPDIRCRCGIYAGVSLETFPRPRPAWPPPPVVGTVSLWGTVVEHERGWRGEFAYPARLRLVCCMCAWFEPGPGAPVVVHSFLGLLYTLCTEHRGGIEVQGGRRTHLTALDPRGLQAELLGTYTVDLVPEEAVHPLFELPPTPVPPPYLPSIRSVRPEEM